jgi:hypothetical protein
VAFDYKTFPPNTGSCYKFYCGVSEIDTSVYYWGYCGHTAIKGISYKVNYRTGQTSITSDSLPYFAMTISEDGQYVAGVYYTGGTASNVPYNEVIEVRKISDYSLVFRESRYRQDYDPNFYPYNWVTKYKFRFSKDNKFLALNYGFDAIAVYNLVDKEKIYFENGDPTFSYCDFSSTNKLIFINNFNYTEKEQKISIFDCENEVFHELKFSDKTHSATGLLKELILDKYIIISPSFYFNSEKQWYSGLGDISLFGLNFDINSIQEPDNYIKGTLYPNPTNNNINMTLDIKTPVQLNYSIYSETGQIIKLLLIEFTNPGVITKSFDVSDLPIGTYFLRIAGKNFSQTYKVIINR